MYRPILFRRCRINCVFLCLLCCSTSIQSGGQMSFFSFALFFYNLFVVAYVEVADALSQTANLRLQQTQATMRTVDLTKAALNSRQLFENGMI